MKQASERCAVVSCTNACKPNQLMCSYHWFMLPVGIRNRVYTYYRNGDRVKHSEACLDAIRHIQSLKKETEAQPDTCIYCYSDNLSYLNSSVVGVTEYRLQVRCNNCDSKFNLTRYIQNWPIPETTRVTIRIKRRR